jgi:DMSO/TMAO reductase YedYZ molybdopterin-dependent catalytic subunit
MKPKKPDKGITDLLGETPFKMDVLDQGGYSVEPKLQTRTVEKRTFRFDPAAGEVVYDDGRREPYVLVVDGLVKEPAQFSYRRLLELPQTTQVTDLHCVEGWSVLDIGWKGVRFEEILRRVRAAEEARFAVFHSLGETDYVAQGMNHYIESLPMADLVDPQKQILLALEIDGQPLSHQRGAPLRVVSPFDLAYKSIKYVARIELSDRAVKGWWTVANPIYPVDAPVPPDRIRKK